VAVAPALYAHTQVYLGKETIATVYAAELIGMLMGIELAMKSNRGRAAIFTDNQAALKALKNTNRPSGQYVIKQMVDALAAASARGLHVEFHWIPAHHGIEGNELAVRLTKEATGWTQNKLGLLPSSDGVWSGSFAGPIAWYKICGFQDVSMFL